MFRIIGAVNKQTERIWDTERTMDHNSTVLNSPGVMTRRATSKDRVEGLYYFENEKAIRLEKTTKAC